MLDPDEVIDYQIMEAVAIRANKEEQEEMERLENEREKDKWRKESLGQLEQYR